MAATWPAKALPKWAALDGPCSVALGLARFFVRRWQVVSLGEASWLLLVEVLCGWKHAVYGEQQAQNQHIPFPLVWQCGGLTLTWTGLCDLATPHVRTALRSQGLSTASEARQRSMQRRKETKLILQQVPSWKSQGRLGALMHNLDLWSTQIGGHCTLNIGTKAFALGPLEAQDDQRGLQPPPGTRQNPEPSRSVEWNSNLDLPKFFCWEM